MSSFWGSLYVIGDLHKFIQDFMVFLQHDDVLNKILSAITHFQKKRMEQLQHYNQLLNNILDNLNNPSIDLEDLYLTLKNRYSQLQQIGIAHQVIAPQDAIYREVVARSIKPSIDIYLSDKQRNLDLDDKEDKRKVLKLMQDLTADIGKVITRSPTLIEDILRDKEGIMQYTSDNVAYQEISKIIAPIMQIVNELRNQDRESFL